MRLATERDYELLYREQGARLYHALLGYCGDKEIAREAVAEAFARAIASSAQIREPVPWIWRVGFRVAGDERRRQDRQSPLVDQEQSPPQPPELFDALAKLSARQRATVILHYYAGYSLEEIASILGMKKGTVGVHLHRGRARLKQLLEAHDG